MFISSSPSSSLPAPSFPLHFVSGRRSWTLCVLFCPCRESRCSSLGLYTATLQLTQTENPCSARDSNNIETCYHHGRRRHVPPHNIIYCIIQHIKPSFCATLIPDLFIWASYSLNKLCDPQQRDRGLDLLNFWEGWFGQIFFLLCKNYTSPERGELLLGVEGKIYS